MSFCRWSSLDFQCDLYCYESNEGFVTSIATSRILGDIPKLDWGSFGKGILEEFLKSQKEQFDFLETAERQLIGLPYDGMTFIDQTKEDFLLRLTHLKKIGYIFPEIKMEDLE